MRHHNVPGHVFNFYVCTTNIANVDTFLLYWMLDVYSLRFHTPNRILPLSISMQRHHNKN